MRFVTMFWILLGWVAAAVLAVMLMSINNGEDERRRRELEDRHIERWELEMLRDE